MRTIAPTTVLVRRTPTASASLDLMASLSGLVLTVLFVHVLVILLGLVMLSTPITFTLGLSALTRVPVTASPVLASVSLDMMVLLANVPPALTTVMTVVLAGLRSTLLPRHQELIAPLGMP